MDSFLNEKFTQMGARAKITLFPPTAGKLATTWNRRPNFRTTPRPIVVDVRRDNEGEFFHLLVRNDVDVRVLDVRPNDAHLLLGAREGHEQMSKFLCGHDERAWFVAAIPESAAAGSVQAAKDALKPQLVWDAMREYGVRPDHRDRRRTKAFVRQGEWFFIPRPHARIDNKQVFRNEPISRGGGKPHVCQFLYRDGGIQVHVCSRYPNGLTNAEFVTLLEKERSKYHWSIRIRDAHVYVRGAIRHPDHATVWLPEWHEVVMNTETQSLAMRNVAFLD